MKFTTHDSLYTAYPEFEEIAKRLDYSVTNADAENEIRKARANGRDIKLVSPEHCKISHYLKNGRWIETSYPARPGKEPFSDSAMAILNTREPDAVRIEIYAGKKQTVAPRQELTIAITDEGQDVLNDEDEDEEANELSGIDDEPQQPATAPRSEADRTAMDVLRFKIMELQFQIRMLKEDHKRELERKDDLHERELRNLQETILRLEEELEDAEAELADQDGTLSGLTQKLQEEKEPPKYEIMLTRVAERAITGVLKSQPKFTSAITGLTEEELKGIWLKEEAKQLTEQPNASAASFDEGPGMEPGFEGKEPDHIESIKSVYEFCKQLSREEYRKVGGIFNAIATETGELNEAMADKLLAVIYKEMRQPETDTTTNT